jgi:DNA polymerase-3 subunit delta'
MKFSDVTGQENTKARLIQSVKSNRVSHAQLFLGPEGSGKLALAIAYAQYINCTNRTESDSCGDCASCIKYEKLIHPDLHFIYPTATTKEIDKPKSVDFINAWREIVLHQKGNINLSQWYEHINIERKQAIINVRDCNSIIKTLSYKSYESEYKVMIIWMVEKLYHAAAPRILKVLEEPPEKTLFILVSENQEQIINTILSRTQLVKVFPLKLLALRSKLIEDGFDQRKVDDVVKISDGNYLEAIRILQNSDDIAFNTSSFIKWMRHCFKNEPAETLEFTNKMGKLSREAQKSFLSYSIRMTRESMLKSFGNDSLVKISSNEADFMAKFHPFINEKNSLQIVEELEKSIYHIERNANAALLFFDLSIKMGKYLKM